MRFSEIFRFIIVPPMALNWRTADRIHCWASIGQGGAEDMLNRLGGGPAQNFGNFKYVDKVCFKNFHKIYSAFIKKSWIQPVYKKVDF